MLIVKQTSLYLSGRLSETVFRNGVRCMATKGVNRDFLKKSNRGLALKLIATKQCASRIELSKAMGLTKPAISAIVNELMEKGYLVETHKQMTSDPGPNPICLEIGPGAPKFAGLLLQRGYAESTVCDMNMRILRYERVEKRWKNGEELMQTAYRLLDHMMEMEENVRAIGVSSIGQVDVNKGRILTPLYFNGIENVDVTAPIAARYGLPVFFDHDNQSAALVEQLFGNGRGYQDILMIGIGHGVGCGIVMGGQRYHSHTGFPPEIGHVSIDVRGNQCRCGNIGCLETYIMSPVIEEKVRAAMGRPMDYREICQRENSPAINAIMEEMILDLSGAVVSLLNILNCEIVLLGLDSIYWPDRYVQLLEDIIHARKFSNRVRRTLVRKAGFLDKTQILGAACNAVSRCFEGELPGDEW